MFEVTTLGQPLEVVKTTMAAHRGESMLTALARVWNRGGVLGCELYFADVIHPVDQTSASQKGQAATRITTQRTMWYFSWSDKNQPTY